jgi:chemotaxis protein MotA
MADDFDDSGAGTTMDAATLVGIGCGFLMIVAAIVLGGSPGSFVNPPSVLIVIGGTLCVTIACYSIGEVLHTFRVILRTVVYRRQNPAAAATRVLYISDIARRKGVLSLQGLLGELEDEPLLHKGVAMVIDGTPGEEVEQIMRREMQSTLSRHSRASGVLRKMAEVSPAMGLIGTLIGLVQMLGNLDDPSNIGPSMAVALLTTFYGAVLSNMVFTPLASKLERNSGEEAMVNTLYVMGAASIGRQENPRRLEMLLNSVLPPAKRVSYFD